MALLRLSCSFVVVASLVGASGCFERACEGPAEPIIDLDDAVIPATQDLRGIVRLDSAYLAIGTGGAIVRRERYTDWAAVESPTTADLLAVDHWGTRVVVVGRAGSALESDDDGSSFTAIDLPVADYFGVWLDAQRSVAVGDDVAAYLDGSDWVAGTLPISGASLRDVAADGDALWAVGLAGVILRSDDDGASWSAVASPTSNDLWAIGFAGVDDSAGLYAVGDAGTVLRLDAGDWVAVEHSVDADFRGVGGNYIVGLDGVVVAIEVADESAGDAGPAPQRMLELGRDMGRGDLWDVVDDLAVGDSSRLTTIQIDWVC